MEENNIVEWSPNAMLEVTLNEPDDFLKIRETLTRIGVASRKDRKLYQSCHILHKQGRYFIVHFKELFLLDGKKSNLEENDIARRNTIATLMSDWGLVTIESKEKAQPLAPLRQIKIISYKDKTNWELCPKYNIGNKTLAPGENGTNIVFKSGDNIFQKSKRQSLTSREKDKKYTPIDNYKPKGNITYDETFLFDMNKIKSTP